MIKRLPCPAVLAALLLSACGTSPAPVADPVQLELALATIKQQESGTAARLQQKVAGADRVASTVTRVNPGHLDPNVAVALLR
ncbi:hypothetical protein E2493_15470 [Sphingomonas parva]|uniref:TolC family protein n=1 Tax=Sphingomonas parva TaxID=2555898 RepID=A0A4Y8ZQ29_9SPHN|nr:hypothetical protein [Sphingomonas parva]TFI57382.1 hypothetical protein E2493_15470 [Sphingomonas parva]